VSNDPSLNLKLKEGMVLAIEVMYMTGDWPLIQDSDGWTLKTADGSLSAVFEDDVIITSDGPLVITQPLS
jgi:methionyl aminopeptidase